MNCDVTKDMLSVGTAVSNDSIPFSAVYDMYCLLLTGVQYEGTGFEFCKGKDVYPQIPGFVFSGVGRNLGIERFGGVL